MLLNSHHALALDGQPSLRKSLFLHLSAELHDQSLRQSPYGPTLRCFEQRKLRYHSFSRTPLKAVHSLTQIHRKPNRDHRNEAQSRTQQCWESYQKNQSNLRRQGPQRGMVLFLFFFFFFNDGLTVLVWSKLGPFKSELLNWIIDAFPTTLGH